MTRKISEVAGQFGKAISLLAGPSAIGAAVNFLSTPLLVTWFSPDAFGVTANALAVSSILAPIVTLRLDIVLYRKEYVERRKEVAASALLATFSITTGIFLAFEVLTLLNLLTFLEVSSTFIIVVYFMTLSLGLSSIGSAYQVARGRYLRSSLPRSLASVITVVLIAFSKYLSIISDATMLYATAMGLVLAAVLQLCGPFFGDGMAVFRNAANLVKTERSYVGFSAIQSGVSAASFLNLFMLISNWAYGPGVAGQQFLAFRLVGFPSTIIGAATSNLLASKATEIRGHGLRPYMAGMALVGLFIYGTLCAAVVLVPREMVPARWVGALDMMLPMLVLCFAQFVFGSFAQLMLAWNRASALLTWDALRLLFTCGVGVALWAMGGSSLMATWGFILAHLLTYVILGRLVHSTAKSGH